MESFTVFVRQDRRVGIRFDNQALPGGSYVVAFGTDENYVRVETMSELDNEIADCVTFGNLVLAGDPDAQFAPGV